MPTAIATLADHRRETPADAGSAPPASAILRVVGPAAIGSSVVERLRGDTRRRPVVDPGLAGGLRAWLEDGVATLVAPMPERGAPVVVDRRRLEPWRPGEPSTLTATVVRSAVVASLFGQVVVTGRLDDPVEDGLAALEATGRSDLVAFARGLPAAEQRSLERTVVAQAATMVSQWAMVSPGWLPRVADRLTVPLAGGRVVLRGRADLVLGAPSDGRASVCLVDVRSGDPQAAHGRYRRFVALLETVRSGAPPFRTATYYPAAGDVQVDEVTDELLAATVGEVLDAVAQPQPA